MYLKYVIMIQFIKSDMYEYDEIVCFYFSVGDLKSTGHIFSTFLLLVYLCGFFCLVVFLRVISCFEKNLYFCIILSTT